jgi:coenzyme Q-binding protein COQ10
MKHVERHYSKHTAPQIFDLIADVELYPEFVPWVISAKVARRQGTTMWTDLTMGTGVLRKQFTTIASLDRPHRMEINSCDPIFERFQQVWSFEDAPQGGTNIEYQVDLALKSSILGALIAASFASGARLMVKAYIRRAQTVYGAPKSLPSKADTRDGTAMTA